MGIDVINQLLSNLKENIFKVLLTTNLKFFREKNTVHTSYFFYNDELFNNYVFNHKENINFYPVSSNYKLVFTVSVKQFNQRLDKNFLLLTLNTLNLNYPISMYQSFR